MAIPSLRRSGATPLAGLLALAAGPLEAMPTSGRATPPPPPPPVSAVSPAAPPAAPPAASPGSRAPLASPAPRMTPVTGTTVRTPATPARPGAAPVSPATAPGAPSTAIATLNREILLELGKRQISLLENGKTIRSWPVAIGDPSTPTPTGRFKVENKVLNPQYASTKTGKINPTIGAQGPLGDRWIGFKLKGPNQYGIHGTPSAWAWTVNSRAAVSNGCVRMLTPHVRELFEKVEVGTPVTVTH